MPRPVLPPSQRTTVNVHAYVTTSDRDQLDQLAARHGLSRAAALRAIVRRAFRNNDDPLAEAVDHA
jgi:hypothetical protein